MRYGPNAENTNDLVRQQVYVIQIEKKRRNVTNMKNIESVKNRKGSLNGWKYEFYVGGK